MNSKFYFIIFLLLALFYGVGFAAPVSVGDRKILVINSYSPIKEEGNQIISSFIKRLASKTSDVVVVEYMDCESYNTFDGWLVWMNSMVSAYPVPPDAVVVLGGEAWMTYRAMCSDAWRDIPVILGNIRQEVIDFQANNKEDSTVEKDLILVQNTFDDYNVTGYCVKDHYEKTINLIKYLQPEVQHVLLCYDDRYHFVGFETYLNSVFDKINDLDLHYIPGSKYSTANLLDSILHVGNTSAILTAGWYTDVNHYPHAYAMLHNELARYPDKYMFQVADQGYTNPNYIGGFYVSGQEIGEDLANLTYSVLKNGFKNSPSFQLTPSKPNYHINFNAFKDAGLNEKILPSGTVFHNKERSIFMAHPVELALMFGVVFVLMLTMVLIIIYRKRKEKYYKESSLRLMQLLDSMPEMAIIYDSSQCITDIINPLGNVLLRFKTDQLIGMNIREFACLCPEFAPAADIILKELLRTSETKETSCFNYDVVIGGDSYYAEARTVSFENDKVICFVLDVTARVKAEREVLKLQTFLQSVIDHLPVGMFVKNVSDNYRYIYYNEPVVAFHGGEAEMFLGKNDFEINDPMAQKYRMEDDMVLDSDVPLVFECVLCDSNSVPYKWGIVTKAKLINNDGSCYIIAVVVDTTEMRKNEIELDNIKNELSVALDAGSLSAWLYDVETRKFMSLYQNIETDNDLSFESVYGLMYIEDQAKFLDLMDSIISGKAEKKTEILRIYTNGKFEWYEIHTTGIRSVQNGEIIQVVGTKKNITDEIQKQQELEESKLTLELTFKFADIVPWYYDTDDDLFSSDAEDSIFYNAFCNLDGMIGKIHADYRVEFKSVLFELIQWKTDRMDMIFRIKSIHDQYEWAHITAKAFGKMENGQAKRIIGTRKYITSEVEADRKLKADKFKSDLAIQSSGIIQWDYDIKTTLFSSPTLTSIFKRDLPADEYYTLLDAEDVVLLKQKINSIVIGESNVINIQVRQTLAEQGLRWVEIHGVVFERDNTGNVTKITGLLRDITDLKKLTEELAAKERVEELNRLKSAFLANMSHEIRTPLNAIVGFSNLIVQSDDPVEKTEFCKIIETNNELLLQLVNDILDLSKIEAGQLDFIYTDIDMVSIFTSLDTIYKYRVKNGVELICELPDESCIIHSEKNRLTQVISNFLSNACKFTSAGYIKIGYEHIEGGLRFYVTDTGKGISVENQPRVFDRFAKFDSFVQGTGLGLSICQTIVKHLRGEIGVKSELGSGTTFWFTIPCNIMKRRTVLKRESITETIPLPQHVFEKGVKKTILVAEDNDSNYFLLYKVLAKGYTLFRAENGLEAVKLYETVKPDLILMDIKMPEMDGLAATREIRRMDMKIPIIALTAHAFDIDKERSVEAGCNAFLTKPVNIMQLRELLAKIFNE